MFSPVQSTSRSQFVFDSLKDAIFLGKLEPGASLREMQLAQDFNVSQSTIREALIQLEQLGLVVKVPHKGTYVTKLSDKEIRERLEVRFHLEEVATIEAANQMTAKDVKVLRKILQDFVVAVEKNSFFDFNLADLAFHRYIWKLAGNQILYDTLDKLVLPLFAYINLERSRHDYRIKDILNPHEPLLEAMITKDVEFIKYFFTTDSRKSYKQYFSDEEISQLIAG